MKNTKHKNTMNDLKKLYISSQKKTIYEHQKKTNKPHARFLETRSLRRCIWDIGVLPQSPRPVVTMQECIGCAILFKNVVYTTPHMVMTPGSSPRSVCCTRGLMEVILGHVTREVISIGIDKVNCREVVYHILDVSRDRCRAESHCVNLWRVLKVEVTVVNGEATLSKVSSAKAFASSSVKFPRMKIIIDLVLPTNLKSVSSKPCPV